MQSNKNAFKLLDKLEKKQKGKKPSKKEQNKRAKQNKVFKDTMRMEGLESKGKQARSWQSLKGLILD